MNTACNFLSTNYNVRSMTQPRKFNDQCLFFFHFLKIVRYRWSSCYINPRWFPELDQIEIGLSWVIGFDRCYHFVFLWLTKFDTRRNLLLPIDWPLCGLDIDYVFGIFPNDCNCLVLRCVTTLTEYQTDDG